MPRPPTAQTGHETAQPARPNQLSCYHPFGLTLRCYASRIRHPHHNADRCSAHFYLIDPADVSLKVVPLAPSGAIPPYRTQPAGRVGWSRAKPICRPGTVPTALSWSAADKCPYLERQLSHVVEHHIIRRAVHVRQVVARLAVDGDAERMDAVRAGLDAAPCACPRCRMCRGSRRVVVRLAVGQGDQQLVRASTPFSSLLRWRMAKPMRV